MFAVRRFTRRIGLNRFLGSLMARKGYENRFGSELLNQIASGDTVWDVGANVGFYSAQFARKVGPTGRVVAFEPALSCYEQLRRDCAELTEVVAFNMALGRIDGKAAMVMEENPLAATHSITNDPNRIGVSYVSISCAESIVASDPALFPNVIKVDVEGYEGEVLAGMAGLLMDKRLRCVGFEVHFGLLDARGESDCPKKIERTLSSHGFRLTWTDPSHLLGVR